MVRGKIATEYFDIASAQKYSKITLANANVMDIINVTDSDSNKWYELDVLAQDTIFEQTENTTTSDPDLVQYNDTAPYLLKLRKVSRRFISRINKDNKTELRFGAGVSDSPDEEIIPNPDSIGSTLPGGDNKFDTAFDPTNFLKTKTYGQAPSNTTLKVVYSYGGSVSDNVAAGEIRNLSEVSFTIDEEALDSSTLSTVKRSVAVNNPDPATGGKSSESLI